ncbi:DUF2336 domain-containing protein [Brevundimonas sp. 2R-24]|uniref:DUF2336 domain-containing protein n=1 Tax=Peiella sedimenti TaxID=3061083 RepID=A0ABT8SI10_9CAUL|nr:DUF2336 domain-containing protein [Caulobacteraceae bacterium XZ-24]
MTETRLTDLIALAKEPSSEKRRELLREVTDIFFGAPAPASGAENDLYGAVLAQLSRDMEVAVRAELAARFAPSPHAPLQLVRTLAMDEIDVAAPVLSQSPVLTEQDLMRVVSERGQDHLRAVSVRPEVSEAVADVIVERGDDQTLNVLLANEGAVLSRKSAETVVDRAQANPALHQAVVNRASLPPDLLNEMYFTVEASLRARILQQNATLDPAALEAALHAGRDRVARLDGALPADYAEAEAYVKEMQAAGQLTPQMLARFLRSGGQTHFLIALSQLADIDFVTARHIVSRRQLDALAVVCRAADLDRGLFLTCALILLNDDGEAMGKAQQYGRLYAELPRDAALRTLRFWKMRRGADLAAAA